MKSVRREPDDVRHCPVARAELLDGRLGAGALLGEIRKDFELLPDHAEIVLGTSPRAADAFPGLNCSAREIEARAHVLDVPRHGGEPAATPGGRQWRVDSGENGRWAN